MGSRQPTDALSAAAMLGIMFGQPTITALIVRFFFSELANAKRCHSGVCLDSGLPGFSKVVFYSENVGMFRHHSQAGLQANVKPRPWGVHCFPSDTSRSSFGSAERFQPKETLGAWISRFPQPQDTLLRQIPAVSQKSRNFGLTLGSKAALS